MAYPVGREFTISMHPSNFRYHEVALADAYDLTSRERSVAYPGCVGRDTPVQLSLAQLKQPVNEFGRQFRLLKVAWVNFGNEAKIVSRCIIEVSVYRNDSEALSGKSAVNVKIRQPQRTEAFAVDFDNSAALPCAIASSFAAPFRCLPGEGASARIKIEEFV
jgi:hypothetical protein